MQVALLNKITKFKAETLTMMMIDTIPGKGWRSTQQEGSRVKERQCSRQRQQQQSPGIECERRRCCVAEAWDAANNLLSLQGGAHREREKEKDPVVGMTRQRSGCKCRPVTEV